MAAPTSNPSHLLISRNRSVAHPQLAQTTTSLYSPQPGPHLFAFDEQGPYGFHGSPDGSSYNVGGAVMSSTNVTLNNNLNPSSVHMRSHSTPAFPTPELEEESVGEDKDDEIEVHSTFCRDAALPGRVKVIVGKYEFWCHKEVLWFASPFFNSLLQGCWAETAGAGTKPSCPSSPTDTDANGNEAPDHDAKGAVDSASDGADSLGLMTDQLTLEPHVEPHEAHQPQTAAHIPSRPVTRAQSLNIEYDECGHNEHKASVYLDAEEDPSSGSADILRELRELPEPTGAALDVIENGRDTPHMPQVLSPPHTPQPSNTSIPPERPASAPAQSSPSPPPSPRSPHLSLSPPLPLRLQGMTPACPPTVTAASASAAPRGEGHFDPNVAEWPGRTAASVAAEREEKNVDAVVELHEESPTAFQDFLFWAYPHLECKVTWTNVEGLLALSSKLIVPPLESLCERFLMTHASGRPVVAMAIAEQHLHADLYREASRFVLDQATWDLSDLACLSEQTQLKLSHRRTWFLERLLKLGSIDPKKEYTCRPDCPDPSRCQAQLDEKWRQAHQAVSRYGPPQPSVAYRCLRQLETFPTNPSLVMPHPLCQTAAKTWVMTLFDRMFQPKMALGVVAPGTEKYWLFITIS